MCRQTNRATTWSRLLGDGGCDRKRRKTRNTSVEGSFDKNECGGRRQARKANCQSVSAVGVEHLGASSGLTFRPEFAAEVDLRREREYRKGRLYGTEDARSE